MGPCAELTCGQTTTCPPTSTPSAGVYTLVVVLSSGAAIPQLQIGRLQSPMSKVWSASVFDKGSSGPRMSVLLCPLIAERGRPLFIRTLFPSGGLPPMTSSKANHLSWALPPNTVTGWIQQMIRGLCTNIHSITASHSHLYLVRLSVVAKACYRNQERALRLLQLWQKQAVLLGLVASPF